MNKKIHDAIGSVHTEEALKRSTKAFIAAKAAAAPKPVAFRRMATALACLALVLLSLGSWRLYVTPVAAISVDVNPSIELGVNRFDRVVSVKGYSEDGTALAASVELKNLNYSDALDVLLSSEEMQSYQENDGFVSITVVGQTEQKSEAMQSKINSCSYTDSPNVECQCGNRDDVTAAHEIGLSFGKYRAFLALQAIDPDITVDEIRNMTMRQIQNKIEGLSDAPANRPTGNGNGGNGAGNGGNGAGSGNGQCHGGE